MSVGPTCPKPYNNWVEFVEQVVMPLHTLDLAEGHDFDQLQALWDGESEEYKMAALCVAYVSRKAGESE